MNTVATVEIKKKGVNQKTGKPWTMFQVTTDGGTQATGFDTVKVGDAVELEQKGDFLNYYPVKVIQGIPVAKDYPVQAPESPVQHSNGNGGMGTLDMRQKAIIRQHSQEMALMLLELKSKNGWLEVTDINPTELKKRTDYFYQDVLGTAQE